ncbi:MAG TPA: porin [Polyangiales bacterium]
MIRERLGRGRRPDVRGWLAWTLAGLTWLGSAAPTSAQTGTEAAPAPSPADTAPSRASAPLYALHPATPTRDGSAEPLDLTWRPHKQVWFRPGGLLQARYTFNHRPEFQGEAENTSRFSVPRARLIVDGGLTEYLSFRVRLGVLSDGSASFEQAYADVHLGPVSLRGGIFYLPVSIGDNPGPGDIQALDYSQYQLQTSGGMAAGFGARGEFGRVRVHAVVSNGVRTAFSEFGNSVSARVATTARVEARLLTRDGFRRFDTETSYRGSDLALRLGAAFHYQLGRQDSSLPKGAFEQYTADVTLEGSGFNVIAAARFIRIHPNEGNTTHDPGWWVQAGAFVHERVELWARYDALYSDGKIHTFPSRPDGLLDNYQGVGVGINGYFVPRTNYAKLQLDFLYIPRAVANSWASASDNSGLLQTELNRQWTLRTQLMLSY